MKPPQKLSKERETPLSVTTLFSVAVPCSVRRLCPRTCMRHVTLAEMLCPSCPFPALLHLECSFFSSLHVQGPADLEGLAQIYDSFHYSLNEDVNFFLLCDCKAYCSTIAFKFFLSCVIAPWIWHLSRWEVCGDVVQILLYTPWVEHCSLHKVDAQRILVEWINESWFKYILQLKYIVFKNEIF